MIGVLCSGSERPLAEEFFEFFKTPWEFYDPGRRYPVVVSTQGRPEQLKAQLLVLYETDPSDDCAGEVLQGGPEGTYVDYEGVTFPVYGKLLTFQCGLTPLAYLHESPAAVAIERASSPTRVVRAGYDLFHELQFLLSQGQPVCNAATPTLEIHIAMLRNWILAARISVLEVPPVPAGYEFMGCLTHDVDFVRIQDHKLDHTILGFIKRASTGSLRKLARGEMSWRHFVANLKALLSLPAVHLGLCKDFWFQDFDRFLELERDMKATFFFIPFKDRPGDKVSRPHSARRAAAYDVAKERSLVQKLKSAGNEIGVHGIDAWHDAGKGREEYRRIADIAAKAVLGVRMHWLCFDSSSPRVLEEAGFRYDSTVGYNDTVGYRAGTAQVFRPRGATTLLELPLHIQDTALFYEGHLGVTTSAAWKLCQAVVKNAATYGGVLTLLWHTRSLAPERLWGDFYIRLLKSVRTRRVWFGTAAQVVEWFRKRRAFSFRDMKSIHEGDGETPDLTLRIHAPDRSFVDVPCTGAEGCISNTSGGLNGASLYGCIQ